MVCPFCLHKKTQIYNSRSTKAGTQIWRRRRCLACGKTFTTQETNDLPNIWKIKKDGRAQAFDRARLLLSLLKACDHRQKQEATAWYLLQAVEQRLYAIAAKNEGWLTTADIIAQAGIILKRFDPAAYIKYLSYHHPTMDAGALRKQLGKQFIS